MALFRLLWRGTCWVFSGSPRWICFGAGLALVVNQLETDFDDPPILLIAFVCFVISWLLSVSRLVPIEQAQPEDNLTAIYRRHHIYDHTVETDWEVFNRDIENHLSGKHKDPTKLPTADGRCT